VTVVVPIVLTILIVFLLFTLPPWLAFTCTKAAVVGYYYGKRLSEKVLNDGEDSKAEA
jgi:hypothetical protein